MFYITSCKVQRACIMHRQVLSALERGQGTPEQHYGAWDALNDLIESFDADETRQWMIFRAHRPRLDELMVTL